MESRIELGGSRTFSIENVLVPPTPILLIPETPNKLFQTYLNQLIYRLQVLATLFEIYDNHSTSA